MSGVGAAMAFNWYRDAKRIKAAPHGRVKAIPRGSKAPVPQQAVVVPAPVAQQVQIETLPAAQQATRVVLPPPPPKTNQYGKLPEPRNLPPPPPPAKPAAAPVAGRAGLFAQIEAGKALKAGKKACVDLPVESCTVGRPDCAVKGGNCQKKTAMEQSSLGNAIMERRPAWAPSE